MNTTVQVKYMQDSVRIALSSFLREEISSFSQTRPANKLSHVTSVLKLPGGRSDGDGFLEAGADPRRVLCGWQSEPSVNTSVASPRARNTACFLAEGKRMLGVLVVAEIGFPRLRSI
jgi:hypothetical protein